MSDEDKLLIIRDTIDSLDQQIQALISKRAQAAQQVADIKLSSDPSAIFYRPEREAAVLTNIKQRNKGPLPDDEMARLFREIMSACLALEQPLNVAYLGPEGTFTQTAAYKHFGQSALTQPMTGISDVFREVESGACQYGVVPIENSTEGMITHTLDRYVSSPLLICGEVSLRIHHHFLTNIKNISEIDVIYSHQQSLAQCRGWLDMHMPNVKQIAVSSNAEAARLASQQKNAAAIAGETAGKIYAVNIYANNIEDETDNTTRFLIIGQQAVPYTNKVKQYKTTLMLSVKNESGQLYALLKPLAETGISMTRIESRPSRKSTWDYVFFLDIEGHKDEINVKRAIEALQSQVCLFKVLGSYPVAVI